MNVTFETTLNIELGPWLIRVWRTLDESREFSDDCDADVIAEMRRAYDDELESSTNELYIDIRALLKRAIECEHVAAVEIRERHQHSVFHSGPMVAAHFTRGVAAYKDWP